MELNYVLYIINLSHDVDFSDYEFEEVVTLALFGDNLKGVFLPMGSEQGLTGAAFKV